MRETKPLAPPGNLSYPITQRNMAPTHAFAVLGSDLLQLDGRDMAATTGQVPQTGVELVLVDGRHPPLPFLLGKEGWSTIPRIPRDRPSYRPQAVRVPST